VRGKHGNTMVCVDQTGQMGNLGGMRDGKRNVSTVATLVSIESAGYGAATPETLWLRLVLDIEVDASRAFSSYARGDRRSRATEVPEALTDLRMPRHAQPLPGAGLPVRCPLCKVRMMTPEFTLYHRGCQG
jgi:hypothetical protein